MPNLIVREKTFINEYKIKEIIKLINIKSNIEEQNISRLKLS